MPYKVLNSLKIGNNTAAMISGRGEGLKNGITVIGNSGKVYKVISVGMPSGQSVDAIGKSTDLLIEGDFNEEEIALSL